MQKRLFGALLGVLIFCVVAVAFGAADDIARLYSFTPNTTIRSSEMNAEFDQMTTTMNTKFGRGVANTLTGANTFQGATTFSGATTSSSSATFSHASGVTTDTVTERTSANGVTVDGLKIKDGYAVQPGAIRGCVVQYTSATTVTIKTPCAVSDSTGVDIITLSADQAVSFATGLNTINGMDTAESANSWWGVTLCKGTSGTGGMLSSSFTSGTCPTNYNTVKKSLPIAVRNDASSNIIPYTVGGGWPDRPYISWNTTSYDQTAGTAGVLTALSGGTQTAYTDISHGGLIPPTTVSKFARFNVYGTYVSANQTAYLHPGGGSLDNYKMRVISTNPLPSMMIEMDLGDGLLEYKISGAGINVSVDVAGFYVTEL